jgi:SAM-dependent methyltransferase
VDERLAAHLELAGLSDDEFVERAFRFVMRRPPDDEARAEAVTSLRTHSLSRAALLGELVASEEFHRLRALDDAVARAAAARAADEHPHELESPGDVDERPVEIAWTLGRYRGEARVLDLGYAYAEPDWLVALARARPRELVGVDLVEREVPGMKSVVADLRRLPFPDRSFDVVFCISTLEHVGQENTRYGSSDEADDAAPATALRELHRVTARGGRILLTVPCGDRAETDWFLWQPASAWRALFSDADLYVYDEEVYVRSEDRWRSGPHDGQGVLCAELHPGRLRHELVRRLRGGFR